MAFSAASDSRPVEPAEPDPFTSAPNPLTGSFPSRPSIPFPGPLQLPVGNQQANSPAYARSTTATTQPYQQQSSHQTQHPLQQQQQQSQQRHDSFAVSRGSISHTDERFPHGAAFPNAHDPYCNPMGPRHDSTTGADNRASHPHHPQSTGASDRYMMGESTSAVLQYGHHHHHHHERDPTVSSYASSSASANNMGHHHDSSAANSDIQGATIMGYGSGGLIYIRKRRGNLPKEATNFLKKWFDEHAHNPYPTEEDKQWMVRKTGLEANQISNWFINARRRRKHNRSPSTSHNNYRERTSLSSEPPSPSASVGLDTPLQSPARPPPGFR